MRPRSATRRPDRLGQRRTPADPSRTASSFAPWVRCSSLGRSSSSSVRCLRSRAGPTGWAARRVRGRALGRRRVLARRRPPSGCTDPAVGGTRQPADRGCDLLEQRRAESVRVHLPLGRDLLGVLLHPQPERRATRVRRTDIRGRARGRRLRIESGGLLADQHVDGRGRHAARSPASCPGRAPRRLAEAREPSADRGAVGRAGRQLGVGHRERTARLVGRALADLRPGAREPRLEPRCDSRVGPSGRPRAEPGR